MKKRHRQNPEQKNALKKQGECWWRANQANVIASRTEPEIRKHAAQWSYVIENEAAEEIF